MEERQAFEIVMKACRENDVQLIYMSKVGSHLYGTATKNSDTDYRFLFLPSKKQLLLEKKMKVLNCSSGNDGEKNTSEDVDIQGWSLHYFFELLGKGESNALDFLYSFTNENAVVMCLPMMEELFYNHKKLYNIKKAHGFLGFAEGQATKYGLKGDRLKVLDNIYNDNLIKTVARDKGELPLSECMNHILSEYGDNRYIKKLEKDGILFLYVVGGLHQSSIKMCEFYDRIKREYKRYGNRSKSAMESGGADYKALSHAYRCYLQYIMLVEDNYIQFPLSKENVDTILRIKNGEYSMDKIQYLLDYKGETCANIKESGNLYTFYDPKFIENFILDQYRVL